MILYLLIMAPFLILGYWAQHRVTSTFRQFSQVPSASGMTGAEMARAILDRNGLHAVEVRAVPGELSDHYDPSNHTVNLSEPVFGARSVAAVSVAAHEVGHAIQHARKYAPMQARSAILPAAIGGQNIAPMLIMVGFLLLAFANSPLGAWVLLGGIIFYAAAVLFQLVTLPVEFDASRRAKQQIRDLGLVPATEIGGAGAVLGAAAWTYVAGALAGLASLAYYVMIFLDRR